MVKFLLYLFETGLCLSILFLVYVLFFKKETYFNFNRLYLIAIMILALVVPVIHVSLKISSFETIQYPVGEIGKFRNYYRELIAMTDPEFSASPYLKYESADIEFYEDNYNQAKKDKGI